MNSNSFAAMRLPPTPLLLAALLGLSQCKKTTPAPVDQLPPATQTGANTFGCLVNGQPWIPQGYDGTSNYSIYYDSGYRNGTLNIGVYKYVSGSSSRNSIIIFSDSLKKVGSYPLTIPDHQEALFYGSKGQCEFRSSDKYYRRGTLTITRLDLQVGVISGTFDFTLYKPGCDTIKVTQGRFDKRL